MAGEVSVFKVRLAEGSGGEEDDVWGIGPRGEGAQAFLASGKESAEAFDATGPKIIGEDAGENVAIFEGVTDSAGGLGAVGHYPPLAIGGAGEIDSVEGKKSSMGGTHAVARAKKSAIGLEQCWGNNAFVEKLLGSVDIGEDEVEQAGPLNEAASQFRPFVGSDDQGERAEFPVALGAAAIAEHVVSDAVFAEETADIFSAISETGGTDAIETANEFLPGLADGLIGVAEFIEAIGGRLIVRKNAFGRMDGAHLWHAKHLCW